MKECHIDDDDDDGCGDRVDDEEDYVGRTAYDGVNDDDDGNNWGLKVLSFA